MVIKLPTEVSKLLCYYASCLKHRFAKDSQIKQRFLKGMYT